MRDRLVHLGGVPVVCYDELTGEGASTDPVDPAVERDHLGDGCAGPADDDLFAVLDAVDDPREVRLRVVDVELEEGGSLRVRTEEPGKASVTGTEVSSWSSQTSPYSGDVTFYLSGTVSAAGGQISFVPQ
ncbi:hypothetical protein Axi01nite_53410 [Actinoplanes xinjiangensis]|nr:hypothetical protein Axi01nite_53410 [Actinoplanes xinjiangensis]